MEKKFKKQLGFTLVEVLVAMSVMSVLGVILAQIFVLSLQGSNKAQLFSIIKQNGVSALNTMGNNIRTADQIVCSSSADPSTILVVQNGSYTRYRICPEGSISGLCSSSGNGKILVDNPSLTPQQTSTPSQLTDLCVSGAQTGASSITDDNTTTGVSVLSGNFVRNQSSGYKDSVTVTFSLKPGVNAQKILSSQLDPASFTTTINLR